MSDRIKIGLYLNDKRKSDKHPQIKVGKPIQIGEKQYWVSGYVNDGRDDDLREAIDRMLQKLATANDTYPIISLSLTEAEVRENDMRPAKRSEAGAPGNGPAGYEDDIPFAPIRGLVL